MTKEEIELLTKKWNELIIEYSKNSGISKCDPVFIEGFISGLNNCKNDIVQIEDILKNKTTTATGQSNIQKLKYELIDLLVEHVEDIKGEKDLEKVLIKTLSFCFKTIKINKSIRKSEMANIPSYCKTGNENVEGNFIANISVK